MIGGVTGQMLPHLPGGPNTLGTRAYRYSNHMQITLCNSLICTEVNIQDLVHQILSADRITAA